MGMEMVFMIAVLVMSVVVHEVSHGYVAGMLGDPTARHAGRLTLNPVSHIDPVGSLLVPFIMYISIGVAFGWAKPVPYNPYNLSNQKWGPAMVAAAGPGSNLLMAIIFGLMIRFGEALALPMAFLQLAFMIVILNLLLAVFNMIPIPPLDGSKVLYSFLPYNMHFVQENLERYSIFLIAFIILIGWKVISPVVGFLVTLITGIPF